LKQKTKKESSLLILIAVLNSLIKVNFIKKRFGSVKKEILILYTYKRKGPIIKKKMLLYKKAIDNKVLLNFIKR
jgi:hypothetical protein